MITISRATAHTVRSVLRRAFSKSKSRPIWLRLLASAEGLRIQAVHDQVAIEYRLTEPMQDDELVLPLDLLAACESKKCVEPVQLRSSDSGAVSAEWLDKQIPQQRTAEALSEQLAEFPPMTAEFSSNETGLVRALADACDTTDDLSSRYALGCLNLRGLSGSIVATDGQQLLLQSGWSFPWHDDVLVPGNRVFSSPELHSDQPVRIGQAGEWIVLTTGPWTICLRVQKDARFPQVDDLVRNPEFARSRLTVSPADARFALDAIRRLPIGEDESRAVTLDLNGEVLLRARPNVATAATEVQLVNSQFSGEALRLVSDRKFLQRALALGFMQFGLLSPAAALQADDQQRRYIWMPWAVEGAVPADVDARRITSPLVSSVQTKSAKSVEPCEHVPEPQAAVRPEIRNLETITESEVASVCPASPVEQVIELRVALRALMTCTNLLLQSLKQQRKESQLVKARLARKPLQKAA